MVRAMEQEHEGFRARFLHHFRGNHENTGRHAKSLSVESASILVDSVVDDDFASRSQGSTPVHNSSAEKQHVVESPPPPPPPQIQPEKAPKPKASRKEDEVATNKEANNTMTAGLSTSSSLFLWFKSEFGT